MPRGPNDHHTDENTPEVNAETQPPVSDRSLKTQATGWLRRLRELKPVRVLQNYTKNNGPLLAAGLSFHSIFAAFAALWLSFSIGGLLLEAEPTLRNAVFDFINRAVPGLIDTGDGGVIKRSTLLEARVLSLSGAVALAGLLLTTLGWLASSRIAIRTIFRLDKPKSNLVIRKLKDAGLAVGFGLAVLVSAGLTIVGTQVIGLFRPYLTSDIAEFGARAIGLLVMFVFDAAVLASLFRVQAGVRIPFRRLIGGVLIGAAGLAVLKVLGSRLLVGAGNNPLLASFAVIIGLMIWFNLISQVILIAASWITVDAIDDGVTMDEERR